ncbi:MAG: substrate-binding domain-containing protein [Ginsengibacter sp.]
MIGIKKHIAFIGVVVLISIWIFSGCTPRSQRTDIDSPESGTIHISVDESFRPVIDSQIKVFESQFPKAHIIADYKSEADCFKDLYKDSTRMIIVTRGLSMAEERSYKDSTQISPSWLKVAYDAIAVVVNKDSPDTLFSLAKLSGILDGTTADKELAVFDGTSGSSSFRFLQDSILKGRPFDPKKVFAKDNSNEVLKYVESNKNVIGFVGVSWIGNPEDTAQLSFLTKVKIAAVKCENCEDPAYVMPYQANIMTKKYPLVRGLFYILKENFSGLGGSFANFMTYEKGQLIFRRAYLGPARMDFTIRRATTQ